jgi:hypothetical protein
VENYIFRPSQKVFSVYIGGTNKKKEDQMTEFITHDKEWSGTLYFVIDVGLYGPKGADGMPKVSVYDFDTSQYSHDKIVVHTTEASFTVPGGVDLRTKAVEGLEREKENIRAKAYKDEKTIQDRIDQLTMITYAGEAA